MRLELPFAHSRMLHDLPNDQGLAVGRKHVATSMRRMGVQAIAISMDRNGCWRDNVFIESFWKSVKQEDVYPLVYETIGHAKQSLGRHFGFYNNRRPYSTLDRKAPDKVYYASQPLPKAARSEQGIQLSNRARLFKRAGPAPSLLTIKLWNEPIP